MHACIHPKLVAMLLIALCAYFLPANSSFASTNTLAALASAQPATSSMRALGQARLVVYGFGIYDAKLLASEGFSVNNYAAASFALELRYLRSFSGTMIAERSLKEMRRLSPVSDSQAALWLSDMKKTFPDVKKGDQLIGVHRPDGTASFSLNGHPIGEVRDAEFTRLFFGIWLSTQTSEPKMRNLLIGAAATQSKPK